MTRMSRRTFIASVPPVLAATQIPAWAAPASNLELIAAQKGEPAIVKLYRQLERLTSTVTLMTTGAHPDDEPSGMLAALRHVYGIRPVLYCITRGEGGQNAIGPERGSVLGVLRTREMTEASRSLDASLAFGGQGHNDSVHDFGFSKDPNATIDRWGRDRVIERMTWAFRYYRPDVIMNCFLDVGGQHGHHRAANVATFVTAELSGNAEEFPDQIAAGLKPWSVPKIYLPAYGGGGGVYDDETPPPPTTLTVRAPERDPISGATFPQMGEWSRSCHLTQGMGNWRPDPQTEWALNLAWTAKGEAGQQESDMREGLIATVGHIAELDGMPASAADALRTAQGLIDEAIADYGDPAVVIAKIAEVGAAIDAARAQLPAELADSVAHRLDRKVKEVDLVLATAAGMNVRAYTDGADLRPGEAIIVKTLVDAPEAVVVKSVAVIGREGLTSADDADGQKVTVAADAVLTNPLTEQFDPLGGNGDAFVRLTAEIAGRTAVLDIDLEDALRVIPAASLELKPDAVVLNTVNELEPVEMTAVVGGATTSDLDFNLPEGWSMTATGETGREAGTFELTPPADLGTTRIAIEPSLLDQPAYAINTFSYPHIGKSVVPTLVSVPVQSVEAALPEGAKVGYVGSGNDNVAIWLKRLGVDLVELSPADIEAGAYRGLTTIIVGIFAFGRRKDLVAALPGIHEWVNNGGHLVTLYHRPSDGWDPETVPLAFLKIGSPSIRYRVTDAKAEVTALEPDHPLLNYPNVIGPEDWANWDKERGLYFVSEWDEVYKPLLSMSDAGEEPLLGALVSAEIGEGRHTHTSLVLHHQLDKLTPGAFRLLANLTQPAKR